MPTGPAATGSSSAATATAMPRSTRCGRMARGCASSPPTMGHLTRPAWSPDGGDRQAASVARALPMHADGSHQTRLTFNEASDFLSTWSQDGANSRSTDRDGNVEVYTARRAAIVNGPGTRRSTSTLTGGHSRTGTIDPATW